MDEPTYRSVLVILDYLVAEEERHWEECGKPKKHIYIHLARLIQWADEVAKDYQET